MTQTIVEWLATYALHSTVLLGAIYLLERARVLVELDVRESGWRVAMLAPIATAAVHVALVSQVGAPEMTSLPQPIEVTAPEQTTVTTSAQFPQSVRFQDVTPDAAVAVTASREEQRPNLLAAPQAFLLPISPPRSLIANTWLAVAGAGVLLLIGQFVALRRRFGRARTCEDGSLIAEATEIANRAGVNIDEIKQLEGESTALVIPPATLCIPEWAVTELEPAQRRAMVAHEIAHLARRDPWWRLAHRACARMLFFQPLNWLAVRKLDDIAELACDEWAANTADRRALMECLVSCSERIVARRHSELVSAMAESRSTLLDRMQTLFVRAPRLTPRVYAARSALFLVVAGVLNLPALVFQQPVAAAESDSRGGAESKGWSEWSLDDMRGWGIRVSNSKFGFLGLGQTETTVKVRVPGALLGARIEGDVKFSPAEDSVLEIDGSMVIEERKGSSISRVEVDEVRGEVRHRYQVDKQERAFEPEGRQFLAHALPIVLRESAFQVDARIARLLQRSVDAVFSEVDLMENDFPRRVYLSRLSVKQQLDATQLSRALELTARIDSNFEKRLTLNALLSKQSTQTAHITKILQLVASMDSDFEQRLVMVTLADKLNADAAIVEAWSVAIAQVGADFEARLIITATADNKELNPLLADVALRAVESLGSDFEARLALSALAPHVTKTPSLAGAYLKATHKIGSDYEKRLALTRLIRNVELDTAGVKGVLVATDDMGSEFECRNVLRELLVKLPADQEVLDHYRRSMSRCDET